MKEKEKNSNYFQASECRAVHSLIWVSREREQGRCTLSKAQVPYAKRVLWRNNFKELNVAKFESFKIFS